MSIFEFSTIKELKTKLENKEVSSEEVLDFYLDRLKTVDKKIDSTLEIFSKESIKKDFLTLI